MQSIHPQQQYPSDPFRDTAEKAGSIRSGHVNPYSNNVHGYGHGYPPPLTPAREALTGPGSDDGSKGIKIKRSIAIGGVVAIFLLFATVIGLAAGLGMTQENLRQARNDLVVAQGRLGSSVAYVFPWYLSTCLAVYLEPLLTYLIPQHHPGHWRHHKPNDNHGSRSHWHPTHSYYHLAHPHDPSSPVSRRQ